MEAIEGAAQQVNWFDDEFDLFPMDFMREEEEAEDEKKFPAALVDAQPDVESIINRLVTAVYSGPTLGDVESVLSGSARCGTSPPAPMVCLPEKGLGKMEHKYTLKIKTCGNGLADDGYKWRKYGQKSIKNSPNPRSYYRCTNPRCNAKKQVERSTEDPEMLVVTYEGLHLHYTYSHLLLRRSPPPPLAHCSAAGLHVAKKLKSKPTMIAVSDDDVARLSAPSFAGDMGGARATFPEVGLLLQGSGPVTCGGGDNDQDDDDGSDPLRGVFEDAAVRGGSEGLLEDVVPLLVRRPCSSTASSSSSPASSPSYSWSADSPSYPDLGGLSSIGL